MARGKQEGVSALKDSVLDSEIVRKGEVENEPNYIFPDGNYGITGKYKDYSLVEKKLSYRTGKEKDEEDCDKVIEYTKWNDVPCYSSSIVEIFRAYAKINNLSEFKTKKLMSTVEEIADIQKNTSDKIDLALKGFNTNLNSEQKKVANLVDVKLSLEEDIKQLKERISLYEKYDKEIADMYQTIKDKTTIIINRDKPKKHRTKKEVE